MMGITIQKTAAEAAYLEAFPEAPDWLAQDRKAGFEQFATLGLPHRRVEEYKWTDLRQLLKQPFPPAKGGQAADADIDALLAKSPVADIAKARLIFVDGHYDEARSKLPASGDVAVRPLGDDAGIFRRTDDVIDALNVAYMTGGAVIEVAAASNIDTPIEVVSLVTGVEEATITTRNIIKLGEGASASIIETHLGGAGAYVANAVSEVHLANNARLDRAKLQLDGAEGIHLSSLIANLGESARFNDFTLHKGAQASRQNGFLTFNGEHAEIQMAGAFLQKGRQHTDTALVVDHAVANCISRELFKCVMDDEARGIFQGKVIVRQDAQKTDGKQSSNALLLSDRAEFDAKPELEIYADDVVCGHGATSGELEEDYLFYLRARGIPEAQAKSMLIAAFVGEAFDQVENEALRDVLIGIAENWLTGRE